MLKFKPVGDYVLVEIEGMPKVSAGGIELPEEFRDRKLMEITEGVLVAAGPFAYEDLKESGKAHPKVGNTVYFKRYSGILKTDEETDKEYRAINDTDIYLCEAGEK